MTLSRTLVRQLRAAAACPLPAGVAAAARLHLLDAIGVGLAASAGAVGAPYRRFAADVARGGPASVFGQEHGAAAADAALVNGGLIHSLEYDDTHAGSIVHGSAVLAAAALAAAEAAGASGPVLLGAYARGWEVLVRIGLAAPGGFQARGFQVTSVGGSLVAALVAAELGALDEDATVAALGIALSQASGVFEFLTNGSSVKSLHPGWAAHAGLIAARLAAGGMTGPETALDGRFGLFAAFAGEADAPARLRAQLADFGERWHLLDAAYKFFPCCHYIHPFIEAAEVLLERGVRAPSVTRLLCRVPAGAAPIICEPWAAKLDPPTPHAARWSLPAVLAARLVDGPIELATFEQPLRPAARDFAGRIAWEALDGASFPRAFEAELVCTLHDGRIETVRIADVYGNAARPARAEEVRTKFRRNAARALPEATAQGIEEAVDALDGVRSPEALSAALRMARQGGVG
ncbi:MAG: MmgE/PrpD family protein [Proteobacteria bacterium]|nr:MmgE/PrpD family protein [Pseudomonadota bacterium]